MGQFENFMTLNQLRHKENRALKKVIMYIKKVAGSIAVPPDEGADVLELIEEVRKLREKLGID